MVRGCVDSLRVAGNQLARSIEQEDLSLLRVAMKKVSCHSSAEFTRFLMKHITVFWEKSLVIKLSDAKYEYEKFQRIVRGWGRYIDPIVEIVRPDNRCGRLSTRLRD